MCVNRSIPNSELGPTKQYFKVLSYIMVLSVTSPATLSVSGFSALPSIVFLCDDFIPFLGAHSYTAVRQNPQLRSAPFLH